MSDWNWLRNPSSFGLVVTEDTSIYPIPLGGGPRSSDWVDGYQDISRYRITTHTVPQVHPLVPTWTSVYKFCMSQTPIRRSFLVSNCLPLYHAEKQLTIYAVDKAVVLLDSDGEKFLTSHTDTVAGLSFVEDDSSTFISFGLDGRIIHWNLLTAEIIKELPFIVLASATELSIYWKSFKLLVSYQMPWPQGHDKNITCVAAHPLEASLATGNQMGEIFIWWGLATKVLPGSQSFDQLEVLNEDSEDESQETDSFDAVRAAIVETFRKGCPVTVYPVHGSRVKRNLVHWHCCQVTSVCFTSSGSHLLSGGLEGVMVKWDLTTCYGGPRHRRFLPRLGAPIKGLASPGGLCQDAIMITLENNAFHILSSALKPIGYIQGYAQMPPMWSTKVQVPSNLLLLATSTRNCEEDRTMVLTNAGFGALQLTDPRAPHFTVRKVDVTRQHAIPRPSDVRVPVAYSEVLLVAHLPSGLCGAGLAWFVTYERMVPTGFKTLDDQARLTWWRYSGLADDHQQPTFEPVDSVSLSHLHSPASDLGFVPSSDRELFMLLQDFRLLIWRANPAFEESPHCHAPWLLHSCVQLKDPGVRKSAFARSKSGSPRATVVPLALGGRHKRTESAAKGTQVPRETSDQALLVTDGSLLVLYTLSSLLKSGPARPTAVLEMSKFNCGQSREGELRSLVDRAQLIAGLPVLRKGSQQQCLALALRARRHRHQTSEEGTKSATGFDSFGILCLVDLVLQTGRSAYLVPVMCQLQLPITCICTHDSRPLVAVGLSDGTAVVSEVRVTTAAAAAAGIGGGTGSVHPSRLLHKLHAFASLPAHPLCDRRALHRSGRRQTSRLGRPEVGGEAKPTQNTTRLCRLAFLPTGDLVGLMDTLSGRQSGRRDLVLFGKTRAVRVSRDDVHQVTRAPEGARGLLRLVEPVASVPPAVESRPKGRKRTSSHIDDALRQVSQYPIATAPPPEQLLRQLMQQ